MSIDALITEVHAALRDSADPARAPRMQAYMKSELPFLGVAAGPLRKALRPVLQTRRLDDDDWETAVRRLWDGASHREERYAAEALSGHPHYRHLQDPAAVPLYRHMIFTGAWWDHVDNVAIHRLGPILRRYPDTTAPLMRLWAVAPDPWLRRTAIICQIGSREGLDTDLLSETIEANLAGSAYGDDFFIRKAIGWALRQHARVDPGWVADFVDRYGARLSGLSRREALKHQ